MNYISQSKHGKILFKYKIIPDSIYTKPFNSHKVTLLQNVVMENVIKTIYYYQYISQCNISTSIYIQTSILIRHHWDIL